jgi:hypothetical protein
MTKILFIDFDGPLVPAKMKYIEHTKLDKFEHWSMFDPFAVSFLNAVFAADEDLYGVLHTSWRRFYDDETLLNHMTSHGCKFRFHETLIAPFKYSSSRWNDIGFWLSDHPEIALDNIAIIDDEYPTPDLEPRTVQINYDNGFQEKDCAKLLDLLRIDLPEYSFKVT